MSEDFDNKPVVITEEKSPPLTGAIEWLGKTGSSFMREKRPSGLSAWFAAPFIALGALIFFVVMLMLLAVFGIFLLLRVLSSLLLTGRLPRNGIIIRTFKGW